MNCHRPAARLTRVGKRLVGALHHRQQRKLQRHAARLDLGDDVVHVALAALEYPLEVVGVVLEPGELRIDRRLLDFIEGEAGAHAIEQIVVVLAVVMLPFARHGEGGRRARRPVAGIGAGGRSRRRCAAGGTTMRARGRRRRADVRRRRAAARRRPCSEFATKYGHSAASLQSPASGTDPSRRAGRAKTSAGSGSALPAWVSAAARTAGCRSAKTD